jgi:alkaline phosphatase
MRIAGKTGIALGIALAFGVGAVAQEAPKAKNVIFMIADGCGFNQILATDYYQHGEAGQHIHQKTFTPLAMSTYSADGQGYDPEKFWSDPGYPKENATDSAAAATAMATAIKTYDSAIGVDLDKQPVKNIVEAAEEKGKATGVITTVPLAHATPGAFVAHEAKRNDYKAIARDMLVDSKADVIMGAGNPWFDNDGKLIATVNGDGKIETPNPYDGVGGPDVWLQLLTGTLGNDADGDGETDYWTLIQSRAEFQALMTGDTPKRVVGVLPVKTTAQQERSGDPKAAPYAVPRTETVPTLAEMTRGALNVLDNDPDGFFLMIEGGAVDWASHDNQSGRMIEEVADFNAAIEAVIQWVEQNSSWDETLVVITGDHETGYLCGPDTSGSVSPVVNKGKGNLPDMEWRSTSHTNSLIPLYAKGPGVELLKQYADQTDPKRGPYIDNTEVSRTVWQVLTGEAPAVPYVESAIAAK